MRTTSRFPLRCRFVANLKIGSVLSIRPTHRRNRPSFVEASPIRFRDDQWLSYDPTPRQRRTNPPPQWQAPTRNARGRGYFSFEKERVRSGPCYARNLPPRGGQAFEKRTETARDGRTC